MTFLVTGASGVLGSETVRVLKTAGHHVFASARSKREDVPADEWILADLATVDWATSLPPVDGIAAIGGCLDMQNSREAWNRCQDVNVAGLSRLIDAAISRSVSRFVFTSSAGLYRRPARSLPIREADEIRPLRPYWTSKLMAEQLLWTDEVRGALNPFILRMSSPYAPSAPVRSVLPKFIELAREGKTLTVKGQGLRSQDFVSVWDAAQAHAGCLLSDVESPGPLNLGSGEETSMVRLATAVNEIFENPSEVPLAHDPEDGSDSDRFQLDVSQLQGVIDYHPMSLRQGLLRMREEMR